MWSIASWNERPFFVTGHIFWPPLLCRLLWKLEDVRALLSIYVLGLGKIMSFASNTGRATWKIFCLRVNYIFRSTPYLQLFLKKPQDVGDIDVLVRRKLNPRALEFSSSLSTQTSSTRVRYVRMSFLEKVSYRVERILHRRGYRCAFYPLFTVGHLSCLKDRTPSCRGAVYISWNMAHVRLPTQARLVGHLANDRVSMSLLTGTATPHLLLLLHI